MATPSVLENDNEFVSYQMSCLNDKCLSELRFCPGDCARMTTVRIGIPGEPSDRTGLSAANTIFQFISEHDLQYRLLFGIVNGYSPFPKEIGNRSFTVRATTYCATKQGRHDHVPDGVNCPPCNIYRQFQKLHHR